jgi:hypothetical protein
MCYVPEGLLPLDIEIAGNRILLSLLVASSTRPTEVDVRTCNIQCRIVS